MYSSATSENYSINSGFRLLKKNTFYLIFLLEINNKLMETYYLSKLVKAPKTWAQVKLDLFPSRTEERDEH